MPDPTSPQSIPQALANIALANQIFNVNLQQQNAIAHQQAMSQIEIVALGKCVQALLDADTSDIEAIEAMTARIIKMFDQLQAKSEERLAARQKQIDALLK